MTDNEKNTPTPTTLGPPRNGLDTLGVHRFRSADELAAEWPSVAEGELTKIRGSERIQTSHLGIRMTAKG